MTFRDAQLRLLAYVRERIHNGEFTERGFARLIGISQPHAHNVLKGVRNLSPKVSDSILKLLHLSIVDLAALLELEANIKKRRALEPVAQLPFLASPVGPGRPWPTGVNWQDRFPLPLPLSIAPAGMVMARLAPDPSMDATLHGSDVAILDTSDRERSQLSPEGLYAITRGNMVVLDEAAPNWVVQEEVVLRRVRPGANCHYLVTDLAMNSPRQWERINVSPGELSNWVKARVLWLGREQDRDLPMPQRGRFLYEAISS